MFEIEAMAKKTVEKAERARKNIPEMLRINWKYAGNLLDVSKLLSANWRASTEFRKLGYDCDRTGGLTFRYPVCVSGRVYTIQLYLGDLLSGQANGDGYHTVITVDEYERRMREQCGLLAFFRRASVFSDENKDAPLALEAEVPESVLETVESALAETVSWEAGKLEDHISYQTKGFVWRGQVKFSNEYDERWAVYEDMIDRSPSRHLQWRMLMPILRALVSDEDPEGAAACDRVISPLLPIAFMDDARKINEPWLVLQFMAAYFVKFGGRLDRSHTKAEPETVWIRLTDAAESLGMADLELACALQGIRHSQLYAKRIYDVSNWVNRVLRAMNRYCDQHPDERSSLEIGEMRRWADCYRSETTDKALADKVLARLGKRS